MRVCIACKHFSVDPGWAGTDVTAGHDASLRCEKGHFSYVEMSEDDMVSNLGRAETCPDYELSALAQSKGWKD